MDAGTPRRPPAADGAAVVEENVVQAVGINTDHHSPNAVEEEGYDIRPNPEADVVDLSDLRGTRAPGAAERTGMFLDVFVVAVVVVVLHACIHTILFY